MAHGRHARKKQLINTGKLSKVCATAMTATVMAGLIAPAANADVVDDGSNRAPMADGYVVATRSFPKANEVKANLLSESVSVDVDGKAWSLGESEDYRKIGETLKKQAEDYDHKQAEEKARKESEERARKDAEAKKAEDERAAREEQASRSRSQAASRSDARESLDATSFNDDVSSSTITQQASSKGRAIADGALSLVGGHMDCTMLATLALQKGTGVYFHGWPEDYRNFPGAVETSWGDAQPGDILVYRDGSSYDMNGPGHADHVAIYIGNGMAVHGGWNGGSVAIAQAVTSQGIPEHVYRVM